MSGKKKRAMSRKKTKGVSLYDQGTRSHIINTKKKKKKNTERLGECDLIPDREAIKEKRELAAPTGLRAL